MKPDFFETSSRVQAMRGRVGETLELEVTGSVEGTIWGSGVEPFDAFGGSYRLERVD